MKIHEYQAKAILGQYNVPVPRGEVAFTVEEAEAIARRLGGSVVVKAQIHAGGRGKGGGVKGAKDSVEGACLDGRRSRSDRPAPGRKRGGESAVPRRRAGHGRGRESGQGLRRGR